MSKIFLTGMSTAQYSEKANDNSLSFSGLLRNVLVADGHEVVWTSPSVKQSKSDFADYDAVIVGLTSLTSVVSHGLYGALNIISELWGDERLTILIDTPSPSQIEVSLKAIANNPNNLTKSFYSNKKEYSDVLSNNELINKLISIIQILLSEEWGNTIYPTLPWKNLSNIKLFPNAKRNLHLVNLDAWIISSEVDKPEKTPKWSYDTSSSNWYKKIVSTLQLPKSAMKWSRNWSDLEVYGQISRSFGVLISPDNKDGTYWSYRYIQALNSQTPVITDWRESGVLGDAWNILGYSMEEMTEQKRDLISISQRDFYLANIPKKKDALKKLNKIVFKEKNVQN